VGTIGGKTQTDIGGIDDLFLDALGIMDEVKQGGMKGTRKKAARQLAENDYDVSYPVYTLSSRQPVLHPIQEHQATKVAAAIRQSMENPRMMGLLLKRVKVGYHFHVLLTLRCPRTPLSSASLCACTASA
jgi:histone-lysine N-methyltransferase SETD2